LDAGSLLVVEIGIHTDYPDIQLKGLKGVQLRLCTRAILQVYQKFRDLLRYEIHVYPKEVDLRAAVDIVWGGSPTARLQNVLELELELLDRYRVGRAPSSTQTAGDINFTTPGWGS